MFYTQKYANPFAHNHHHHHQPRPQPQSLSPVFSIQSPVRATMGPDSMLCNPHEEFYSATGRSRCLFGFWGKGALNEKYYTSKEESHKEQSLRRKNKSFSTRFFVECTEKNQELIRESVKLGAHSSLPVTTNEKKDREPKTRDRLQERVDGR